MNDNNRNGRSARKTLKITLIPEDFMLKWETKPVQIWARILLKNVGLVNSNDIFEVYNAHLEINFNMPVEVILQVADFYTRNHGMLSRNIDIGEAAVIKMPGNLLDIDDVPLALFTISNDILDLSQESIIQKMRNAATLYVSNSNIMHTLTMNIIDDTVKTAILRDVKKTEITVNNHSWKLIETFIANKAIILPSQGQTIPEIINEIIATESDNSVVRDTLEYLSSKEQLSSAHNLLQVLSEYFIERPNIHL